MVIARTALVVAVTFPTTAVQLRALAETMSVPVTVSGCSVQAGQTSLTFSAGLHTLHAGTSETVVSFSPLIPANSGAYWALPSLITFPTEIRPYGTAHVVHTSRFTGSAMQRFVQTWKSASKIRCAVRSVRFADGTTWQSNNEAVNGGTAQSPYSNLYARMGCGDAVYNAFTTTLKLGTLRERSDAMVRLASQEADCAVHVSGPRGPSLQALAAHHYAIAAMLDSQREARGEGLLLLQKSDALLQTAQDSFRRTGKTVPKYIEYYVRYNHSVRARLSP